jgi:hypothetical protein
MKKVISLFIVVFAFSVYANAQSETTPWQIYNLEEVNRMGSNTEFDAETCTATFKGNGDRWIDVPGMKGDISEHTTLVLNILQSDCVLKICVRYKDENGKVQQTEAETLYGRMGKSITEKKALKIDLTGKGKVTSDMLKNVVSVRLAMAKGADGKKEPWTIKFGKAYLQ